MTENKIGINPITLFSEDELSSLLDRFAEGLPQLKGFNQLDLINEINRRRSVPLVEQVSPQPSSESKSKRKNQRSKTFRHPVDGSTHMRGLTDYGRSKR